MTRVRSSRSSSMMTTRRRRGAALILVVVVIAALLAIAAPFVVSMRLHEQSARAFHADVRARQLAETARNHAVAHLMGTHPDEERRAREARGDRTSDDEGHDDQAELTPGDPAAAGLRPLETRSQTGDMALVEVADARARIDLNACGPDPIANLLGVTVTTAVVSYDEEDALPVEDASMFFSDGDPETRDGFVRVNGEEIIYKHVGALPPARSGEPPRPALMGLVRRAFFSGGPPPEESDQRKDYHPQGSLVQDGRAWKVAYDAIWRHVGTDREGQLARFDGPAAIRRIADWDYGTLKAAIALQQYGVNLTRLRALGITQETVLDAGLDPALLGGDEEDETPEEKEKRQEAERKLGLWGISVDGLKRFGGTRAVLRAYEQLSGMEAEPRAKQIERMKERADALAERGVRLDGWLKDELKRQLKDLSEQRENAPHLETIGRVELEERIRPFMTTDAPPVGEAWSEPLVVNHRVEFQPFSAVTQLRLQDPRRFMADMIVRVQARDRSRPPEFRYCWRVRRDEAVHLFPQLDWEYGENEAEVSARLPAPINVHTAPREVLVAVLTGLMSRAGQTARARMAPDMVTPAEAAVIADAIIDQPPADLPALAALLLDLASRGEISGHDVDAVGRNAVDPMDAVLLRSTVPFAFASGDVYELTATGIVNDPAGLEVGRRRFREAVRVAPPRDLVWTIDSQWDFSDRLYIPGPPGPGVQPDPRSGPVAFVNLLHAWSNLVQTRPNIFGPYSPIPFPLGLPSRSHAPGEGDIQPVLAHEPDQQQGNTNPPNYGADPPQGGPAPGRLGAERNFDRQLDGAALSSVSLPQGEVGARHFVWPTGSVCTALGPGGFRAWLRLDAPPGAGARAYVFDGGKANGVDRLSLYFDGPQELVLSLDDEALDVRESAALGVAPRATELRLPLPRPVQAGNWYHVAAQWKGAEPNDLLLTVDGRAGGRVTLGSRLTQALDPWTGTLQVEDASMLPAPGFVRVGGYRWAQLPTRNDRGLSNGGADSNDQCEVLYVSRKQGNLLFVDTPPVSELQTLLAQGATLAGVQPNPGGQMPANARRPQRGSGRQYTFTFNVPGQPRPARVQLALGFAHAAGTTVIPYGYHSKVSPDPNVGVVRRGQATLVQPLYHNTPATVLYAPVPGYTFTNAAGNPSFDYHPQVVLPTATELPVLWAGAGPDAAMPVRVPPRPPGGGAPQQRPPGRIDDLPNQLGGWPPMGIVRIVSRNGAGTVVSHERVFYRGIDPVGGRLLNCIRGVEGTTPTSHFLWGAVVLESIVVTDPRDYPDRAAISDGRVYASLTQRPGAPGEYTEWLSIQKCSDPRLVQQGLLMIPCWDTFTVPYQVVQGFFEFPYQYDLIRQMLTMNGNLGAAPGVLTVQDPLAYDFGQPYKEVLKRWNVGQVARSAKGTARPPIDGAHGQGTRVVPTFLTLDRQESGWGDIVTVADDTAPREEQRVVHGANSDVLQGNAAQQAQQRALGNVGDVATGWLVAFDDFPGRQYDGAQNARLARWPVGNLHSIPQQLTLGSARPPAVAGEVVDGAPGVLQANVDDLSSQQLLVRLDRVAAVDAQATTMLIEENAQNLRQGQLYRLDDEVFGVVDAAPAQAPAGQNGTWAAATVVRGALGTTPQAHGDTFAWRLYWPAHAVADGGFAGARRAAVPIRGTRGDFREADGYVAIDRGPGSHARWAEQPFLGALPYARQRRDHLVRPIDAFAAGAFDHAFGSEPAQPRAGDLLIDLPFRPHDLYAPRVWSYEGVFFSAARELPGAYVTKVDWDETLPSPFCEVKVAVRLDGAPSWDADPADQPGLAGRLYLFDDPREPNEVLVRATRVELRVYLTFKPGAFYSDAWKRGPLVGAVRVHYRQPIQSLRREERSD